MMLVRRILVTLLVVVVVAVAGFAAWVATRQDLRFDTPLPALAASSDSAVIARGHYLVRDVAPCAACHGAPEAVAANAAGEKVVLSGGYTFAIPPGSFHVPNITPDPETGIGRLSDGQLARALRYGVGRDGRALLPFMEIAPSPARRCRGRRTRAWTRPTCARSTSTCARSRRSSTTRGLGCGRKGESGA